MEHLGIIIFIYIPYSATINQYEQILQIPIKLVKTIY